MKPQDDEDKEGEMSKLRCIICGSLGNDDDGLSFATQTSVKRLCPECALDLLALLQWWSNPEEEQDTQDGQDGQEEESPKRTKPEDRFGRVRRFNLEKAVGHDKSQISK
jgi:hypothetical protein